MEELGGEQAAAAVAGGALTCTYITLQLLLRGGLAEPSRADHFAAAHGARREGSRARHRRGRWRQWARSRHTRTRGIRRFPRRGGRAPRALCWRSSLFRRPADRSRTRAGAAGTRAHPPSFSAPSRPPGAPSRRLGSGRAQLGLSRDTESGARRLALRPLGGTGPPASAPCCGPHAARAHTMPARGVRSAPPAGAFSERGAIFSFPLLRGGPPGRRVASRWQRTQGQVPLPIRLGSASTGGEARGVAWRRGGRGSAAGGWVCAPASDEGGDQRRDEAQGGSAPGRDPSVPSPALLPHPGARGGFGEARPGVGPPSPAFPPPLPTIGRLQLLPRLSLKLLRSASSQNKGRGGGAGAGRERDGRGTLGSVVSGALGSSPPCRPGPARWARRRSPGTQRHLGTSAGAPGMLASSI